jgi:hypothetical protein
VQASGMPALLLLALIAPLLAGCVPGGVRSDGVPTVDAPFTLVALDVGQAMFRFRCMAETPLSLCSAALVKPGSSFCGDHPSRSRTSCTKEAAKKFETHS